MSCAARNAPPVALRRGVGWSPEQLELVQLEALPREQLELVLRLVQLELVQLPLELVRRIGRELVRRELQLLELVLREKLRQRRARANVGEGGDLQTNVREALTRPS